MERYLITQSLLSSWAYTFDCFKGGEDEAYADFIRTLKREKGETTVYMQNGINFENLVTAIANDTYEPVITYGPVNKVTGEVKEFRKYDPWYDGAKKVADIIKGASIQVKASREITVDGMSFLVYGILDALKAGIIYDVKFINTGFESSGLELAGRYLTSAQHPAYFYVVPEAYQFKYLASDGSDLYIESYTRTQTRFIGDIIHEFITSISGRGLIDLYKENWLAL